MKYRLPALIILITAVLGVYWYAPQVPQLLPELWQLLNSGTMDELALRLKGYGPWTILFSIFLDTFANIAGLPTVIFSGANGLIFGFWGGVALSWAAEILGAVVAFFVFRTLLRQQATQYLQRHERLQAFDNFTETKGFVALLAARIVPFSPSGVLNLAAAISRMSFRDFFWATTLGKLPSVMAEVYVGRDVLYMLDNKTRLVFWLILAIIVYLYLKLRQRQQADRNSPESRPLKNSRFPAGRSNKKAILDFTSIQNRFFVATIHYVIDWM